MRYINLLLLTLLFFLPSALTSQISGGRQIYSFLQLPQSARISALGGSLITVQDDDINLAGSNPAALNPALHQQVGISHSFHVDGISHGYAAYGHHLDQADVTLHGSLKYISYGEFQRTNAFFQQEGTFRAGEYALTLGAARTFEDRLTLGANIKVINSQLDSYRSFGIGADLATIYRDTASQLTFTIVFQNLGSQLSTYDGINREPMPFEIQAGVSKRLRYLPFRFSIIYHNLQRWNILYDDPNAEQGTIFLGQEGNANENQNEVLDNLFRHFIFSGELLLGAADNFRLRFGYNHLVRRELGLENFGSLSGFSFGVGFKVNRFRIDYGRHTYHLAGGQNHFSLSTNIKEFK